MITENDWWKNLQNEEIYNNAYGVPPYDVEEVAEFIEKHIDLNEAILDLGCGPGRLGQLLARRNTFGMFRGIDISETMIKIANTDSPFNWFAQISDGQSIPFQHPFSSVYSVTVFQHLTYPTVQNYINQIHDLLLPRGEFIFTYAVGNEDTFLSHQVSDDIVRDWLHVFTEITYLDTPNTHPNWYWVKAVK